MWLYKLAQKTRQQILDEIWTFYRQQSAESQSLRDQQNTRELSSYYELAVNDYQLDQLHYKHNQDRLNLLLKYRPEVQMTQDAQFIQNFEQEIQNIQQLLQSPPQLPIQSEVENLMNKEVLSFYAEIDSNPQQHIIPLLDKNNIYYDFAKFPTGRQVFVTEVDGQLYVIEQNQDGMSLQEAEEWIENAADYSHEFYNLDDNIWEEIGPDSTVYHATEREYLPSILKTGLTPSSETRGLSNRNTGEAVFASENPDSIEVYGDVIIEINLGQMKRDGYMPQITREEPVQEAEIKNALAHAIGLDDYDAETESDIAGDTVVIYGVIPPKYLKVLK